MKKSRKIGKNKSNNTNRSNISNNNVKTYNGFNMLSKLMIFVPLIIFNFIDIPYNLSFIFNNFIFYLIVLISIITLIKNNQFIYAIFVALLSFILINKSMATDPLQLKPSEENKQKKMIQYNIESSEPTLEEDIIKHVIKNPINTPDTSKVEPSECSFSKKNH